MSQRRPKKKAPGQNLTLIEMNCPGDDVIADALIWLACRRLLRLAQDKEHPGEDPEEAPPVPEDPP